LKLATLPSDLQHPRPHRKLNQINLLGRLADCFQDGRSPRLVVHQLSEMLAQRIYGLALGYALEARSGTFPPTALRANEGYHIFGFAKYEVHRSGCYGAALLQHAVTV